MYKIFDFFRFYYSWGYRAHVEFDKKLILEATAKVITDLYYIILKLRNAEK